MSDAPRSVPLDLNKWLADNAHEFEPPVSNKVVWQDADHTFMVIRGPNARSDFHIDPFDEIFMQLKGSIRLDLMVDGRREQHWIHEGNLMLVPAFVPHSPQRPADTWGVVIERPRDDDQFDSLVWFCDVCGEETHRITFHLRDIETELAAAMLAYNGNVDLRTCPNGHVNPIPEPFAESPPGNTE